MMLMSLFPEWHRTRIRKVLYFFVFLSGFANLFMGYAELSSQVTNDVIRVPKNEILDAMKQCQGYDLTATTNGPRFQAEVILKLVRWAEEQYPNGSTLFVDYADWFFAFLDVTGRTEANAPTFARMAYQHKQNLQIGYRADHVIKSVREGPKPQLAVNVKIWWEKQPKGDNSYSYQDTLSTPNLKVTNHRMITYRLLDFGDWIAYDEIKGLTGRPTSGALGFLFRLIGEGRVVESRMAISSDGWQVSRAQAKKAFFGVKTTVTVLPDGNTRKDIPDTRPDLKILETKLKQPIDINYMSFK